MNTDHEDDVKLTLPFDAIDRAMLPAKANSGQVRRADRESRAQAALG